MTLIPLSATRRIAPSLNSLVKTLRSLAIANPPQLNLGLHTILTHCPIWWDQTRETEPVHCRARHALEVGRVWFVWTVPGACGF